MADNKLLQQMLEHLVNDEQAKAEELFHEYVVQQSREIYESLIDSEIAEEEEKDEDEEMDEAAKADKEEDEEDLDESSEEDDEEDMDENFDTVAIEGDDEMDLDSEDPTDDLAGELGGEEGEEKGEEELFQDLEAIVDELQAKFDELKGVEGEEHGDDFGGEEEMKDAMDLATVREYVEKVPAAKMGDKGENNGLKFSKNDMGGTTANILSGRNGADAGTVGAGSTIKGSALSDTKPTDNPDAKGNINVPGGKAGKTGFTHKEPGHGAEKKGAAEKADNTTSLFRGRR